MNPNQLLHYLDLKLEEARRARRERDYAYAWEDSYEIGRTAAYEDCIDAVRLLIGLPPEHSSRPKKELFNYDDLDEAESEY